MINYNGKNVARLKKIQIFRDIRIFYTELLEPEDEGTALLINIANYLVNKISLQHSHVAT
jgi:hypothetical protein